MSVLWVRGGLLISGGKNEVVPGDLVLKEGRIVAVGKTRPPPSAQELLVDGLFVSPGFIDLHVHGGGGKDFLTGASEELAQILGFHLAHGTTGLLATTVTSPFPSVRKLMGTVAECAHPALLGVHLEGPFLSPTRRGAQNPEHLLLPSLEAFAELTTGFEQLVKVVTLAPELPGAPALIRKIRELGAVLALGHSDATYEEAVEALGEGVRLFSHLGNAMRGLHHREPGAVGAALDSDAFVELICDGVHLHPAFVRLVAKVKGFDRICLVTDAISAAGLPDGEYSLGGLPVLVQEGIARLADGTLAGSTLTMDKAVKNFREFTGCSLREAVRCATLNPARLLDLEAKKGSLEVGKDADLVIFDENFTVHYTILQGKIVYRGG